MLLLFPLVIHFAGAAAKLVHVAQGGLAVISLAGESPEVAVVQLLASGASLLVRKLPGTPAGCLPGGGPEGPPPSVAALEQMGGHVVLRVSALLPPAPGAAGGGGLLAEEKATFGLTSHGAAWALALRPFARTDGVYGYRALVRAADHSLQLLQEGELL